MDDENNGKPYEQMDDLGGKPNIFGNIHKNCFSQAKKKNGIFEGVSNSWDTTQTEKKPGFPELVIHVAIF